MSKINRQCYDRLEEIKSSQNKILEGEKSKIIQRISKETEENMKKMKRNNEQEIENMIRDAEVFKQKNESELNEIERLKQSHLVKLEKLRSDINIEFENEKKNIEKEKEKQIKSIRQEENGELSTDDRALLYNLEKELNSNLNKEILSIRSENAEKIRLEKVKHAEEIRFKVERNKVDFDIQMKGELFSKETELKNELDQSIFDYRTKKESDFNQLIYEYEQKLLKSIESEEQHLGLKQKLSSNQLEDEHKVMLEAQIRGYQREIANYEHQFYIKNTELNNLKDEESKIRTEIKRTEIETEDLKGQEGRIEGVVIADLEKQLSDRENELLKYGEVNVDRVSQLEREVNDLKRILYKQRANSGERAESDKVKATIAAEKEELKNIQNLLKKDREKWNREMKEYKSNPSERKRNELNNIKRIIEKNIQKHNTRVKELKQAEEMMKFNNLTGDASEDEELILEMWRNAEVRPSQVVNYNTRQPWQNHNLHVYQRQVNKWCKSREYMKDVMTRHGSWLNNMKEQLNRVMSTPHTIKTYY